MHEFGATRLRVVSDPARWLARPQKPNRLYRIELTPRARQRLDMVN